MQVWREMKLFLSIALLVKQELLKFQAQVRDAVNTGVEHYGSHLITFCQSSGKTDLAAFSVSNIKLLGMLL